MKIQVWQRMKVEFIAETEDDQTLLIQITEDLRKSLRKRLKKPKAAQQEAGSRSKRYPESVEGEGSRGGGE